MGENPFLTQVLPMLRLIMLGLSMSQRDLFFLCSGGLVGGPTNCSHDEDLLLFRLSTNPVEKRAATFVRFR
jgi:hypothetical protein